MIWVSTRDGRVTYAGPEWAAFTGQPTSAALDDGWLKMLHPEDRTKTAEFFRQACATMSAFTIEYRLHHISDTYVSVVSGAVPSVSTLDQSFLGYLGTVNAIGDHCEEYELLLGNGGVKFGSKSTRVLAPIDRVANYLSLARLTAAQAGEERILASVDFAISEVMRRLGYQSGGGTH